MGICRVSQFKRLIDLNTNLPRGNNVEQSTCALDQLSTLSVVREQRWASEEQGPFGSQKANINGFYRARRLAETHHKPKRF
jgi:hypothetical protein